jgi:hypothetical protein
VVRRVFHCRSDDGKGFGSSAPHPRALPSFTTREMGMRVLCDAEAS